MSKAIIVMASAKRAYHQLNNCLLIKFEGPYYVCTERKNRVQITKLSKLYLNSAFTQKPKS